MSLSDHVEIPLRVLLIILIGAAVIGAVVGYMYGKDDDAP